MIYTFSRKMKEKKVRVEVSAMARRGAKNFSLFFMLVTFFAAVSCTFILFVTQEHPPVIQKETKKPFSYFLRERKIDARKNC